MFILLVASSESPSIIHTVEGLATAALIRKHDVTIFFNAESVRLLKAESWTKNIASLASQGVRLLACRTSATEHGVSPGDLAEGAKMSSLGELVELMEGCDRAVFIG